VKGDGDFHPNLAHQAISREVSPYTLHGIWMEPVDREGRKRGGSKEVGRIADTIMTWTYRPQNDRLNFSFLMQEQLALPEPPPPSTETAAIPKAYANGTSNSHTSASTNGDLLGDLLAPLAIEAPPVTTPPPPPSQVDDPGDPLALALYDQQVNQIKVKLIVLYVLFLPSSNIATPGLVLFALWVR
jgi:hypothetical protein